MWVGDLLTLFIKMKKKESIKKDKMKIQAYITKQIYKNKENNFSIYAIALENGEEQTITGILPDLAEEMLFEFEVEEVYHPKYGLQYKVHSYKPAKMQNKTGLINYLSSDLFFGVGPVKASMIVEKLGDNAIDIILKDKNVLRKLGFNPLQTERFYRALYENQKLDKILVELFSYGLTLNLSMKLFNFYSYDVVEIIKENPYRLIYDIENIGFLRADEIAKKLGFLEDDPKRIEAAIVYSIDTFVDKSGHTYLTEENFFEAIKKLLNINSLKNEIEKAKNNLTKKKLIFEENNTYTLTKVRNTEKNLAKQLLRLLQKEKANINLDDLIVQVEKTINIIYTEKQKEAIKEAINNPLTIITGGPGTGKTTVLLGIVSVYALLNGLNIKSDSITENVGICAPTGRAARRISELTGIKAFTIHRLLGYSYDKTFVYDEENQLTQSLFIIDEASMIDIYLAENLFKAIPVDATVVIVGDKDQLPSVGPGQVLADVILTNKAPVIILDEIHRQSFDSGIIQLANDVNKQIVGNNSYNLKEDLIFLQEDTHKIVEHLIKLTDQALEKDYDLIEDLQVLIPMYKGPVGIDIVNQAFQNHFQKDKELFLQRGTNKFFIGDKVMHLVNSPDKGVMNGDIGKITSIYTTKENEKVLIVKYQETDVLYSSLDLDELTLAYAISIHKSQGSEYKIVFIPLVKSYSIMLRKELLYTAITRAKSYLYLIGQINLIGYASGKLNKKRQTKLNRYLLDNDETDDKEAPNDKFSPYDFM